MIELLLLLLLIVANGSPVVAHMFFGSALAKPLDGGLVLTDGHRLLGPSKTVRGLLTALSTTTVLALLLGFAWYIGPIIAAFAMLGDALSSFVKRRLGLPSHAMALALDQIPESLFPLLACKPLLGLSWTQVWVLTIGFVLSALLISRLLYHLGVRHHPY